jgi:hypothetical protein
MINRNQTLNATKRGGQGPAEPFRIAGNLYYIAFFETNDVEGLHAAIQARGGTPSIASPSSDRREM